MHHISSVIPAIPTSKYMFCSQESLAFMFEMAHLYEDALREYDELELCYLETGKHVCACACAVVVCMIFLLVCSSTQNICHSSLFSNYSVIVILLYFL
jgi:hypothetical protein